MKVGKIIYFIDSIKLLFDRNDILNKEILEKLNSYKRELNNFHNISSKVYDENKTNINDFKTIFNSIYNSEFKSIKETFENNSRIFYNNGFKLDVEKQMLMFEAKENIEVNYEYYRQNKNSIIFFFKDPVDVNLMKLISKDENGFNIEPKEIIVENSLGKTYFLEDFSRFFATNIELDVQTYISNLKTVTSVEFVFDSIPSSHLSTYKFFKVVYKDENEVILNFKKIFNDNKIVKLKRNISDKSKVLRYSISFDNGVSFNEFDWKNSELNGLDVEDDIKIISIPEESNSDLFIKIIAAKDSKSVNNQKVVGTKKYNSTIMSSDYVEDNMYEYILDNHGGVIDKNSIKVYLSNKFGTIISSYNNNIVDTFSEPGKVSISSGFINTEKESISDDDIFFLCDFDDLNSLKAIKNEIGFFRNDSLYLPSLFANEEINFRVLYDVNFYENDTSITSYTPFIFDFDIMAGDS
ncbi:MULTISPECIES: hypothetical protein [Bacteria]|uniref:hypothetical protein n=1 Tax=Bacteria TaxID=2 RepID=UPI003F3CBC0C